MARILIVYLATLFTHYSQAQQSMLICTPHLNELVNAGIPRTFIFERGDNYCAAIGDNSAQVVEDGITWLLNKIADAFITTPEVAKEDWELDTYCDQIEREGCKPYEETASQWLQNNQNNLHGMRHFKAKVNTEQEDWLKGFVEFWDLGGGE